MTDFTEQLHQIHDDMKLRDLPIRDGINLAGSICSIVAVLMTLSITLNIAQWTIVILGFSFGVCILGLLLSCVKYATQHIKWLQPFANNPFCLILIWAISILISLFLAFVSGWIFGSGCFCLYLTISGAFTELPQMMHTH